MRRVLSDLLDRHLMRAECALDRDAVYLLRTGPSLRGPEDDHGPRGAAAESMAPGIVLNLPNLPVASIERRGEQLVHGRRIVALDEHWLVAVPPEPPQELGIRGAPVHRGPGDLVAVQVENRKDRSVVDRIEKLVPLP